MNTEKIVQKTFSRSRTIGGGMKDGMRMADNRLDTACCKIEQKQGIVYMNDCRQLQKWAYGLSGIMQKSKLHTSCPTTNVIQARVPNYAELMTLKDKLPRSEIIAKLRILVQNMIIRRELLDVGDLDEYLDEMVEADGSVKQDEYERLVENKDDKTKVYQDASRARRSLDTVDKKKLHEVLAEAETTVGVCHDFLQNEVKTVFGTKGDKALENYKEIASCLDGIDKEMDERVSTDYNGDNEEMGRGGFAEYSKGAILFTQNVFTMGKGGITTAIHECAHLSNPLIRDYGYYGTSGFETMKDNVKLNNAAHYEVVPCYILGDHSVYNRFTTHSSAVSGSSSTKVSSPTPEQQGKKQAIDYLEKAWSSALSKATLLNRCFLDNFWEPGFVNLSKNLSLSIHQQSDPKCVSMLDLTLIQDIARSLVIMMQLLNSVPSPPIPFPRFRAADKYRDYYIDQLIIRSNREGIDRKKIDYLVK